MKDKNILDLHFLLKFNKLSSTDLCRYYLKRIKDFFNFNCSFSNIDYINVFKNSYNSDTLIKKGLINILTGIPFVCKDNFVVKNTFTTSGSKLLRNFISPYDCTLIKKLRNLGSVFISKSNMNEFGVGYNNFNNYYGVVKNSWNTFFSSGGSSGGSACAVSLKLSPFAVGSDTGGSLRQPGSLNNVVGLKPTYGRISRHGLISYSSSLDQPGLICNNLIDCSLILNAISGFDIKDSNTLFFKKEDYTRYIGKNWLLNFSFKKLHGLILGVSKDFYIFDLDYDLRCNFEFVLSQFEFLGAKIIYISFNFFFIMESLYYIISSVELSSNLSRFDGIIYGYNKFFKIYNSIEKFRSFCFSDSVKDKLLIGNYILSSKIGKKFFINSKKIRKFLLDDFQSKFNLCDFILTPVIPVYSWYIYNDICFYSKIFIDSYTTFVNFLGLPSLNIPSGFLRKYNLNIPLSFQIVGNYFKESRMIQVCNEFQNLNKFFFNSSWV